MKNLLTLGTSHMTDMHYDQFGKDHSAWNSYVHYDKGEKRWVEYLAEKLNYNLIDMSIGSFGIDTYPQRLLSAVDKADVALIEIPDYNRHEIFLGDTDNNDSLQKKFWDVKDVREAYVYKYTSGDYNTDHTKNKKFIKVNKDAELKLTSKMVDNSIELTALTNVSLVEDKIWSTIVMMDGYLNSKGIETYWFSWNFSIERYDTSILYGNIIDKSPLFKNYDRKLFVDGAHLISELWKELVDSKFIKFMENKND